MLLRMFQSVAEALERDSALLGFSESPKLFRKTPKSAGEATAYAWRDRDGLEAEQNLAALFENVSELNAVTKATSDPKQVCFFVEAFEAVMHVPFRAVPDKSTVKQYAVALDGAVQREILRFQAGHNDLSGLPNRQTFDAELRDAFAPWIPGQGAVTDELTADQGSQEAPQPVKRRPFWLMSMDIDHFKQINDSYDHQHGDIVLQAFAQRLAATVEQLQRDLPAIRFTVAHPSGEEFFVLASGELVDSEAEGAADKIRVAIRDIPLPSDSEWKSLAPHRGKPNVAPPPVRERNMTVSIGVVSERTVLKDAKASVSSSAAAGRMKEYAEDALHRAKKGGRDAVCNFTKIIERYGTVVEHNPETDLVVIDIGRTVDVVAGMRFDVFHPDFAAPLRSGEEKAYIFADGRTEKRIGLYPEWASGVVEVMEVQAGISFCTIVERKNDLPFGRGYRLKLQQQATAKRRKKKKKKHRHSEASVQPITPSDAFGPAAENRSPSPEGESRDAVAPIGVSKGKSQAVLEPATESESNQPSDESSKPQDQLGEDQPALSPSFHRPSSSASRLFRLLEHTPEHISELLAEAERLGKPIAVAVFALESPRGVVQARGIEYAANGFRNLADVAYSAAEQALMGRALKRYVIEEDLQRGRLILAMIPRQIVGASATVSELATMVIDYATMASDGVRLFRAGVFDPAALSNPSETWGDSDGSKLRPYAAMQYALIALEARDIGVRNLVRFGTPAAVRVFERAAAGRRVTAPEVEILYKRFVELGIDTGELHLAAAAAIWQLTKGGESDTAIFRHAALHAVSRLPDDLRARRTAALSALALRNVDEAFEHYEIAAKIGGAEALEGVETLALGVLAEYAHRNPQMARGSALMRALRSVTNKPKTMVVSQAIQAGLDAIVTSLPPA